MRRTAAGALLILLALLYGVVVTVHSQHLDTLPRTTEGSHIIEVCQFWQTGNEQAADWQLNRCRRTATPEAITTHVAAERLVPQVIAVYPHDPEAFTQGLLLHGDSLYESTGLYGSSTLREVDPHTGEVLRQIQLSNEFFGEGLERVGDRLIQLTWREETAFVYELETFELVETFSYETEGWGLCYDGESLFMSDGSDTLFRRDPDTFAALDTIRVTLNGEPVIHINELECVEDDVYANIWLTDSIVRIDKTSGDVTGLIDAGDLLSTEEQAELGANAVLNGIAYNPDNDTFLITGKLWPWLFEVRFVTP
jgi:glutaminyl-peptide cyclotransferase